jgi:hypothetical protein
MRAARRMGAGITQLRRLRKLFLLLLAVASPASATATPVDSAAADAVRTAWTALDKHQDGFWLDARPSSVALLDHWYAALRGWTAAELETGRAATLTADATRLDKSLAVEAWRLPAGAWLVAAGNGSFGTVFALAPRNGHLTAAWSLGAPQRSGFPSLAAWRADHSRPLCKAEERCGPLGAWVRMLPAEADGSARFLVFGTYTFPLGATVGGQLSVWRWRASGAEPLLVKVFSYMIEDTALLPIEGGVIRLRVKDQWQHLFACGGCSGRQVEWRWRLLPRGIAPVGSRSLVREVDLVDRLIGRVAAKRRTADLASPSAAGAVRRLIDENGDPGPVRGPVGGMLNGWTRRTAGSRTLVCLSADAIGTATYELERRGGRLRVVRVLPRRGANDGCGKGAHS